jgi:1-deoxy-D-xylulose-5-phosphate synthase
MLAEMNIDVAVLNCRFIKPIDEELITHVAKKNRHIMVVEENVISGGLGSRVVQILHNNDIQDCQISFLGIDDEFTGHGPQQMFRNRYKLDSEGIYQQALKMMSSSTKKDCFSEPEHHLKSV